MEEVLFKNRREAGRFLAGRLSKYAYQPDVLVMALPRGGVPIAYEIATALDLAMDVFTVRKLGVPGFEELAMGAIGPGGVRVLNEEVVQHLGLSPKVVEAVATAEAAELNRRERLYRGDRPRAEIPERRVILVDDGLATGSSMRAAVQALRQFQPASVTVAVPVASAETCRQFRSEVNEIVCGRTPKPFLAVGRWYEDFGQTTDEEVSELLNHAAHLRRVHQVQSNKRNAPRQTSASPGA